jgi:flagellar biosynthesis chaperone FliJ
VRFHYTLQKALEWTEVEESATKLAISRLMAEAEILKARRVSLERNLEELLGGQDKNLALEWAPYVAQKVPADAAELRNLDGKIGAKQAEIGTKKAELNRLLLRRKGLESLKDKRRREFRLIEGRREQKRADDNHQILKLRAKNHP